jgi:hypothetical protein
MDARRADTLYAEIGGESSDALSVPG